MMSLLFTAALLGQPPAPAAVATWDAAKFRVTVDGTGAPPAATVAAHVPAGAGKVDLWGDTVRGNGTWQAWGTFVARPASVVVEVYSNAALAARFTVPVR